MYRYRTKHLNYLPGQRARPGHLSNGRVNFIFGFNNNQRIVFNGTQKSQICSTICVEYQQPFQFLFDSLPRCANQSGIFVPTRFVSIRYFDKH